MPIIEDRSQLEILYNVSRQLAASLDLHEVLARVLLLSTGNLAAERASLVVLGSAGKPRDAVILYKGGLSSASRETINAVMRSGLAGWVVRHRQPVILENTRADKRWLARPYEKGVESEPKSALCLPVNARERIVGVLTIVHPQPGYFTEAHLKLQQAIADLAGIAIHNAQLYEDAENNRILYRKLFEGSPDPIFITTLDGKIIDCNRQAALRSGLKRRSLLTSSITSLDPLATNVLARTGAGSKRSKSAIYESTLRIKEHQVLPVEVSTAPVAYRDHDCLQWIFRDISARRDLEALRDNLTAMIYHDLRSPLANIISGLELLSETLPPGSDHSSQQLLQIAGRSSAHMQRLVSSLLDINRLESGEELTRLEPLQLEKLLNESVEIISPLERSKQLVVVKQLPGEVPEIKADEDMIRRVIINLLENAARYSPPHSRVVIGINVLANEIIVFVEDQGTGIPEDARERIFEKYVRLGVDNASRGLGLGLAFCRLAVQAHGGKIWVENVHKSGSRFMFSLPYSTRQEITPEG